MAAGEAARRIQAPMAKLQISFKLQSENFEALRGMRGESEIMIS